MGVKRRVYHSAYPLKAFTMAHNAPVNLYPTPYEQGNRNQTTQWGACIAFYEKLASDFPGVLQFFRSALPTTAYRCMPVWSAVMVCSTVRRLRRKAAPFSSTTTAFTG